MDLYPVFLGPELLTLHLDEAGDFAVPQLVRSILSWIVILLETCP